MNVLKQLQRTFKGNLCILANNFAASRVRIRVISYTRSRAAQARLVEYPQGYPVAAPGRSQHQYGLAADLSVSPKTSLGQVGQTWLQMGGWWSPSDPPHFAMFNPQQWAAILAQCGPKKKAAPTTGLPPIGQWPMPNFPGAGWPIPGLPLPMPPVELPPAPTPLPLPPAPLVPLATSAPYLPQWNIGSGPSVVAGQPVATTMTGRTTLGPVSSVSMVPAVPPR